MTSAGEGGGVLRDTSANGATADADADADGDSPRSPSRTLRPPIPVAKRLNRNALTVAAALAGVTVLTVLVVTNPSRPSSGLGTPVAAIDRTPAMPAHAAFLDQPPRVPNRQTNGDSSMGDIASKSSTGSLGQPARQMPFANGSAGTRLPPGPTAQGERGALPTTLTGATPPAGVATGGPASGADLSGGSELGMYGSSGAGFGARTGSDVDPRAEAYQAALTSSVFAAVANRGPSAMESSQGVGAGGAGASPAGPYPGGPYPGAPVSEPVENARMPETVAGIRAAPIAQPPAARPPAGVTPTPATWSNGAVAAHLDSAGSPYTLWAGTLIPGLLLTGLNSDLPGEVLGQMSRDVYDSRTQQILLLPKGSRLIGAYDNRSVATGRIIVSWTRLILPDGRSMSLPRLAATDQSGQAGLHDQVDAHYAKIYGAALMTSAITAGIQLSQPQQSVSYAAPSPGQIAAGSLGQNIGDVSLETARRGLDIPPTIIIRPGQPFNVFLSGDVAFDGPYVPAPAVGPP